MRLTFQMQAATKLPGHPLYKLPASTKLNIDVRGIPRQSHRSQDCLHICTKQGIELDR